MHLFLWYIVLVCRQYDMCMLVDIVVESGICVFRKLCPVGFLVVSKCSSFCCSLYLCRMLIVVFMGRWSDVSAC